MRPTRCAAALARCTLTAISIALSLVGTPMSVVAQTDTPRLERQPLPKILGDSNQLIFSPKGDRFAHHRLRALELWQTQPLKQLAVYTGPPPSSGYDTLTLRQLQFRSDGRLDYIVGSIHAWITPDLQHGVGGKVDWLSPDGRHAVRINIREGEEDYAPQYYGVGGEVYNLIEKQSVCQFPSIPAGGSFGAGWYAVRLSPTGPKPIKPIAVCDLVNRRGFLVPIEKAQYATSLVDPKGRWLLVQLTGEKFFGGYWHDAKLYALPLRPQESSKAEEPYPCANLSCGEPPQVPGVKAPVGEFKVSPDGDWLVGLDAGQSIRLIKAPEMKLVATLAHADHPSGQVIGARRVVFSANGHWLGLQAGRHLYKADLRLPVPQLIEVGQDNPPFELHALSSDGRQWLVNFDDGADSPYRAALWREAP